jgi:pimeloyl-ACP methyl ester carboxylesterase
VNALARAWARRGRDRVLCGRRIFTVDIPARGGERLPPLLVLHGFPSSSFDFHQVADRLAEQRRVLLYDMLGYGLSEKPDVAYSFPLQADIAVALVADLGIERLGLLTHDVGDTLGGELLARQLEGRWPVAVTDRALTNGSIYYDLTRLSSGQLVLLDLPDAQLSADTAPDRVTVMAGVAATFSPDAAVAADELAAQGEMITNDDGQRLLPRLVRYIEERRRDEARFTGAIERHPSPLTVVWGRDDPIAVGAMAYRLARARPDLRLQLLDGVGHYPMVEAPDRFLDALAAGGFGVAPLVGGSGGTEDLAVDGDEPPVR